MGKLVGKCEDNTVETMLTDLKAQPWYAIWAQSLAQPPFYQGKQNNEVYQHIIQICEQLQQGDSCIRQLNFPSVLTELTYQVNQRVGEEINQEHLVQNKPLVWDSPFLYLQRYWSMEQHLARQVAALSTQHVTPIDLYAYSDLFSDAQQKQALAIGVNSAFAMITGGPGTGKTYILTRIVAVLKKHNPKIRIAMAAPTGKAAQRMQESLQKAFNDSALVSAGLAHSDLKQQQTQTLHRLLGMGYRQVARFNQNNPLPYDIVVVDEASMLDLNLACSLFNAIQAPTRLILLGDAYQLSSVDVGCVLADLSQVQQLQAYHATLLNSRRFSDDACIGRFARFIYRPIQPEQIEQQYWLSVAQPQSITEVPVTPLEEGQDWVGYYQLAEQPSMGQLNDIYARLAERFDAYIQALKDYQAQQIDRQRLSEIFDDYRILVAMRYFDLGLDAINNVVTQYVRKQLQQVHQGEWFLGRPVMMTYNDYQLGLSNGDIGICLIDTNHPESYQVYFPSLQKTIAAARLPQSIQTAFALTIHKSQGSEFNHVAIVLDQQAQELLSKELLYTAITRAKKMVSLYSSTTAIQLCLMNDSQRTSGLVQQIQRVIHDLSV